MVPRAMAAGDAAWAALVMDQRRQLYERYSPVFWRPTRDAVGLRNAFHLPSSPYSSTVCATPAPADWDVQADATSTYSGDKWKLKKNTTTYGATVKELLDGDNTTLSNTHAKVTTVLPNSPVNSQFDPATADSWVVEAGKKNPRWNKMVQNYMADSLLKYKGAQAGEIDWRPTETIPEDYYAM